MRRLFDIDRRSSNLRATSKASAAAAASRAEAARGESNAGADLAEPIDAPAGFKAAAGDSARTGRDALGDDAWRLRRRGLMER